MGMVFADEFDHLIQSGNVHLPGEAQPDETFHRRCIFKFRFGESRFSAAEFSFGLLLPFFPRVGFLRKIGAADFHIADIGLCVILVTETDNADQIRPAFEYRIDLFFFLLCGTGISPEVEHPPVGRRGAFLSEYAVAARKIRIKKKTVFIFSVHPCGENLFGGVRAGRTIMGDAARRAAGAVMADDITEVVETHTVMQPEKRNRTAGHVAIFHKTVVKIAGKFIARIKFFIGHQFFEERIG
ncbi:MAG: hypothetical protein IJH79_11240, partial [Lentisphaeria bacterium]|nr:hypothetical protein [Lentisphaeria bacterium]